MQNVRKQLAQYKGVKFQINNTQSINLAGAGSRTDVGFVFRGPDIEKLIGYATRLPTADRNWAFSTRRFPSS